MPPITHYLPFAPSITPLQATTYLLGTCLFSISFLVFLNSSISFVITDLLNIKDGVGDLVGTLGFVDELVALIACPVWGIISDRLGVKWVCGLGYAIVGCSLALLVQSSNVYPQLLVARMGFSLGGSATWVYSFSYPFLGCGWRVGY
jgi:MFS family permease